MARTDTRKQTQPPPPTAIDDPPPEQAGPTAAPPTPPKRKAGPGRPGPLNPQQTRRTVFSKMEAISVEDWGTRAFIHLYRMEPFTDRLRSGNVVHIMKYAETIDEDRVMHDHGSGKYRAILTFRKPSAQQGDEIDRVEFEILNERFPPNIPEGEWVDDVRNKKWAWAKAAMDAKKAASVAAAAQPVPAAQSMVDSLRVFNEIQQSAEDRAESRRGGANDLLETLRVAKELLPPPPPPTDNTMLQSIVKLLEMQATNAQSEARELRAELREVRNAPKQDGSNGMGTVKELFTQAKELLPMIKEFFPGASEVVSVARGRAPEWWQGPLERLAEGAAPAIPLILQTLLTPRGPTPNGGPPFAPNAPMLPNPAQPQSAPTAGLPPNVVTFLETVVPGMMRHLENRWPGEELAESLYSIYGEYIQGVPWMQMKQQAGVDGILQLLQRSRFWSALQLQEPALREFLMSFIAWQVPADDDSNTIHAVDEPEVEVI